MISYCAKQSYCSEEYQLYLSRFQLDLNQHVIEPTNDSFTGSEALLNDFETCVVNHGCDLDQLLNHYIIKYY